MYLMHIRFQLFNGMNFCQYFTKNASFYKIKNLHFSRYLSTIFAMSSGMGKSGVAVIRISGSRSSDVLKSMVNLNKLPIPKMANLRTIHDPKTKEPLDKGIVLWFPGPRSFTGEDVCELHVHGSKAVIQAVLAALSKLKDFRPAEPGEFTKRAFYMGKFDLTEVEGLADLIDAETEMQRKQALYQMEGSLGNIYMNWRTSILQNMAQIEAFIDFSEEENIENYVILRVESSIKNLKESIEKHLNDFRKGEILRDGIRTAIIGSPNVGKSSLLNVLCRRPAAIVTDIPGTTRDVVESTINIGGYPVLIADTAGIREGSDIVEKEGIKRSMDQASSSNLLILLLNIEEFFLKISKQSDIMSEFICYYSNYQKSLSVEQFIAETRHIVVINKIDLLNDIERQLVYSITSCHPEFVLVSCKTEEGIPELLKAMSQHFQELCGAPDKHNPSCSRARHRYHLTECVKSLNQYLAIMEKYNEEDILFAAEELRTAGKHLGKITGAVAAEEILDVIFKNFCIGK